MFSALDFAVFAAFLLLSLLVGLYHSFAIFFDRPKPHAPLAKRPSATSDFLDGGRRLPILPVCLSLLTTFISGISLLSVPAEIYTRGTAMAIFALFGTLSFPLIGTFFVPIFLKLKFLNAYEYFEHRFQSPAMRRMATMMFIVSTLVYMAVVIYAPAIALAGITGLPLWPFVLLVGIVATMYTAAGGIRAVIWTDTLQAGFIYAGLAIIIVKGTVQVGGLSRVFAVNERTGRLWGAFETNPSLLQYNSIWMEMVGGMLHWTCSCGVNQMGMQRYCSMPSLRHSRIVMSLTWPATLIIQMMVIYIGLLLAAYFDGCNPLALGEVRTVDQMTILMASRIFEGVPGLPGMFLATIFSATLSTASSGINSLTAVLWEDFLKMPLDGLSEARQSAVMKAISVFFGVLATCMAFACAHLGGIFNVTFTIMASFAGTLVGLFFLGIFVPSANKPGAFLAFFLASAILLCASIFNNIQMPYGQFAIPDEPDAVPAGAGCVAYEAEEALRRANLSAIYRNTHGVDMRTGHPNSMPLARLSPLIYAATGVFLVQLIGIPASWLIRQRLTALQKRLAFACTYQGLHVPFELPSRSSEQKLMVPVADGSSKLTLADSDRD